MDPQTRRTIADLERRLSRLQAQVPVRLPVSASAEQQRWLLVIGGNTLDSGQDGLLYASSVTPAAVYDPDVDTAYPDGLGRAWLFVDGVRQANRVLIRHNFLGHTGGFMGGAQLNVVGTETLTYSATNMTAYTFGWT